jgi:hypothetical protein
MGSYRRAALAGMEEERKSWKWIFCKFKGRRTLPALRQRPSVVKPRAESGNEIH